MNWHSAVGGMTKSELIAELAASNPHLRGADVELIVATIFDEITGALARGERVELRGFGAFTVKRRNARTGRNPRTGEAVPVDEKAVPFFKAGKELRDRVNRGKPARSPAACTPGRGRHAAADRTSPAVAAGAVRAVQHRPGAPGDLAHRLCGAIAAVARGTWRHGDRLPGGGLAGLGLRPWPAAVR